MRRTLSILVGLLAIGAGAGAALGFGGPMLDRLTGEGRAEARGGAGEDAGLRAETAEAEEAEFFETFPAVGTTRAVRSVDLTPRAAGVVVALDIPSGSRVEAGYGLVQLDDRAERAVQRQADARLGDARAAVERARQLAAREVAADAALETAEAALALAEAEYEAATVAVEDMRIVAPFAGTVGLTDVEIGQRLDTTQVVTALDDVSTVEITFTLPENLFGRVEPGQSLRATGSVPGLAVEGEVETVGTRIDPAGRFFEARGRFDNPDGRLATGMFMNMELTLETRRSVAVPEIAVVNVGEEAFVYVPEGGEARERAVRVGLYRDGAVEIVEGIEAGETVITSSLQSISDGAAIEVAANEEDAGEAGAERVGEARP